MQAFGSILTPGGSDFRHKSSILFFGTNAVLGTNGVSVEFRQNMSFERRTYDLVKAFDVIRDITDLLVMEPLFDQVPP